MPIVYIRILKFELRIEAKRSEGPRVVLAITLSNDLGELTYHEPLDLALVFTAGQNGYEEALSWSGLYGVQKYNIAISPKLKRLLDDQEHISCSVHLKMTPSTKRRYKELEEDQSHELFTHYARPSIESCDIILGCTFTADVSSSFDGSVCRDLPGLETTLRFYENTKESIVSHIWDAGLIFTSMLVVAKQSSIHGNYSSTFSRLMHETFRNSSIVFELGTGIGLASLAIAQCFPELDVHLSDLPDAEDLVQRNIAMLKGSHATFHQLDWTAPISACLKTLEIDVLVMTDVTYNEKYHDALFKTIHDISKDYTKILFASKYRHIDEQAFIARLRRSFKLEASITLDKSTFEPKEPTENLELGDVEMLLLAPDVNSG